LVLLLGANFGKNIEMIIFKKLSILQKDEKGEMKVLFF